MTRHICISRFRSYFSNDVFNYEKDSEKRFLFSQLLLLNYQIYFTKYFRNKNPFFGYFWTKYYHLFSCDQKIKDLDQGILKSSFLKAY